LVKRVDNYFDDVTRDVLAETVEVCNNTRRPSEGYRETISKERLPLDKVLECRQLWQRRWRRWSCSRPQFQPRRSSARIAETVGYGGTFREDCTW
jgi:hypothetical protein